MMQPLDKTVYGPFKKFYATAMKGWMADNKGRPLNIYNVPYLVAKAYPKAMTPENIMAGFKATGIFPHDKNIFPADAFLPAQVTDRPDPTVTQESGSPPGTSPETTPTVMSNPHVLPTSQQDSLPLVPAPETSRPTMRQPSMVPDQSVVSRSDDHSLPPVSAPETTSTIQPSVVSDPPVLPTSQHDLPPPVQAQLVDTCASPTGSAGPSKVVTPSDIRPFTRAPPRKKQGGRRSGSTRILTDTPVKNEIAMKKQKRGKTVKGDSNVLVQQQSGEDSVKPVRKRLNKPTTDTIPPKRKCRKKLMLPKGKSGACVPADDVNPSCLYSNGLSLESVNEYRPWIQCQGICEKWCHRICAGVDRKTKQFLCEFCAN